MDSQTEKLVAYALKEQRKGVNNIEIRQFITENQLIQKDEHEYFICSICTDIVLEPTKCQECEKYFCGKCIERALVKDKNCPDCQ